MKNIRFILYGIIFSILLIKVEAISWFRIQEMFLFDSFHMYGVLFSAIGITFIGLQLIKFRNKSASVNDQITLTKKPLRIKANAIGGILFGLGWAITGACPGPIYALVGLNILPAILVLLGALLGTYVYFLIRR